MILTEDQPQKSVLQSRDILLAMNYISTVFPLWASDFQKRMSLLNLEHMERTFSAEKRSSKDRKLPTENLPNCSDEQSGLKDHKNTDANSSHLSCVTMLILDVTDCEAC